MESHIKETGVLYEKLMMRAYRLDTPVVELGADKKIYYLLYYIRIGVDLRQTGYPTQFNTVKSNLAAALEYLLQQELHKEERIALRQLWNQLSEIWSESVLEKWLKTTLRATDRVCEQESVYA